MVITPELIQELIKEENVLKVGAYFGTFKQGDFRYLVSLFTATQTVIFEFCEN